MGKKKTGAKRRRPRPPRTRLIDRLRAKVLSRAAEARRLGAIDAGEEREIQQAAGLGGFLALFELIMMIIELIRDWRENQ